jgi:adenylate cyclase
MLPGHRARNRAKTVLAVLAMTSLAAAGFGILMAPSRPWLESAWIGIGSGLLIGGPLILWVLYGTETGFGRRLKRLPLLGYLAANALMVAAVVLGGHLAAYHLLWAQPGAFLDDPVLPSSLVFSVALVTLVSVVTELRRLIGPGVFGAVLLGRYRRPREEDRIFLLLDIMGSTGLAERLGPERFLDFLDRWIHDLTEPLLESGGRIYRYVGDEAILTWERVPGAAGRAVEFALAATRAAARQEDAYRRDFGAVPRMRAALHAGTVMAGEIGDLKREIAFLGDTLNTAARIAEEARGHDGLLLASAASLDGVTLPPGLARRDLGPVALRGRAEPVALALITTLPGIDASRPAA